MSSVTVRKYPQRCHQGYLVLDLVTTYFNRKSAIQAGGMKFESHGLLPGGKEGIMKNATSYCYPVFLELDPYEKPA